MASRVLAFDTSSVLTSVAICDGPTVLVEDDSPASDRHAEVLLPRLERCLAQAQLTLAEIDLIAVGVGPGSFTGVRVGVATAKGLGLALRKPVCGVSSLAALAQGAALQGEWLAPLLDAFKSELFGALFQRTSAGSVEVLAPFHAEPRVALERVQAAAAGPLTLCGAGYRRYAAELGPLPDGVRVLDPSCDAVRARDVATLGFECWQRGEVPELAALVPLYVRDSDARLPSAALRL